MVIGAELLLLVSGKVTEIFQWISFTDRCCSGLVKTGGLNGDSCYFRHRAFSFPVSVFPALRALGIGNTVG